MYVCMYREGSIGGAGGAVAPPTEMVGGQCPVSSDFVMLRDCSMQYVR